MAKNFVQDGMTISILNAGTEAIESGDVVLVGNIVAVAITSIAVQDSGDGFTEGVFRLPKASADVFTPGAAVYFRDGVAHASAAGSVYAGIAWEAAAAGTKVVDVKINASPSPAVAASGG